MMRYQVADYNMDDRLNTWASAMQQADEEVTAGNNPILPSIIHKIWYWPVVFIEFYFDKEMVGLVSFLKVRNTWVSLPHFDHDSLWVNYHQVKAKIYGLNAGDELQYEQINSLFYDTANQVIRKLSSAIGNRTVIQTFFEATDFKDLNVLSKTENEISMICRNRYSVLKHHDTSKVIPMLSLKNNYDDQLENFSSNVRRKIRKSKKNGIAVKVGGIELVDDFYAVYRKNIRSLGSFGLPKSFFQHLIARYQFGFAGVFVAMLDEKPVGSAILLNFTNYAENGWFASLKNYNSQYVTYALHDAMIRYAIENQCKIYSFGRSTAQSSGHLYKKQWSTTDVPMVLSSTKEIAINPGRYNYISDMLKVLPDKLLNPMDGLVSKIIY